MKKTVILCALMALAAINANAQFRVQSDGKIAVHTNSTALSPISINGTGNADYYINCNASAKNGIRLTSSGNNSGNLYGGDFLASSANRAVGLKTKASTSNTCFGLMAAADCSSVAFGVYGGIYYTNSGAAIYGSSYDDLGSALDTGRYAGFFHGDVKTTGSITVGTTIQGALLGESSSESGSSVNGLSLRTASVSQGLSGLSVTAYHKARPALPKVSNPVNDTLQRNEIIEPNIIDEQFYAKNHYALDAEHLEEAFPDLVYVRKDGSKAINYMEMIPLLVQSINELNEKIEILETQMPEGAVNAARVATDIESSSLSKNVLYQNTPNPFREQTTIRFSLADDTQSASICIFDMTGKMLKNIPVSTGDTSVSLNGWELGEGMFLYTLIVNGKEIDTRRMIITK